jgi:hypothetical protein
MSDRALEGYGRGLRVSEGRHMDPTHGRQGKRPAFGSAHVVGAVEEFTAANDTRCWRFSRFAERNQSSERHPLGARCGFGP